MSNFTQLCVWPGTVLGDSTPQDFENFFLEELGTRVKYHTEVKTLPDLDPNGKPVPETGGRNDLFFFVHKDDIGAFAIARLSMGIMWWEDAVKYNNKSHLYTPEFLQENPVTW